MALSITPTQSQVQARLRAFLLALMPAGAEVVEAQDNRVPEPIGTIWAEMTPLRTPRIETNIDTPIDCRFTAGIDGIKMSVDAIQIGELALGAIVSGDGVAPGTMVTTAPAGGGPGDYGVSISQEVDIGTVMGAGQMAVQLNSEWVYQIDFHTDPASETVRAGDLAQAFSMLFRDQYAVAFFAALGPEVTPLHADDPRQMPFTQDQQQYELRWLCEAHMQVNQTISTPAQFADSFEVEVISVEANFPL